SAFVFNVDWCCTQEKVAATSFTIEGDTGAAFGHCYPKVARATATDCIGEMRDRSAVISRQIVEELVNFVWAVAIRFVALEANPHSSPLKPNIHNPRECPQLNCTRYARFCLEFAV